MGTYNQKQRDTYSTVKKDGKAAYPIGDKKHARLALAFIDKGGLSPSQKATVRAKADKMLGTSGKKRQQSKDRKK